MRKMKVRLQPTSGVPNGGEWGGGGSGPPHFSKSWSSRFAQKCKKIGGGGVGQICQKEVSEILEKQAKTGFSRVRSKVLVSKKCLNTAGRGILSQSRILISKNFPRVLPPTHSFQYLLLYLSFNIPLAIGIPVCCLG